MNKHKKILILGILCMFMCMVFFGCSSKDTKSYITSDLASEVNNSQTDEVHDTQNNDVEMDAPKENSTPLCIYVCGEVENSGVYRLKDGSRVADAIEAAGGFKEGAAREYWNLAELLTDGKMIFIPTEEEASEMLEVYIEESDGNIDINTATVSELTELSGIGQSKAEAIVEYRTKNGNFSSVDELTNVPGIGESTLDKIRDYIKV